MVLLGNKHELNGFAGDLLTREVGRMYGSSLFCIAITASLNAFIMLLNIICRVPILSSSWNASPDTARNCFSTVLLPDREAPSPNNVGQLGSMPALLLVNKTCILLSLLTKQCQIHSRHLFFTIFLQFLLKLRIPQSCVCLTLEAASEYPFQNIPLFDPDVTTHIIDIPSTVSGIVRNDLGIGY